MDENALKILSLTLFTSEKMKNNVESKAKIGKNDANLEAGKVFFEKANAESAKQMIAKTDAPFT